MGTREDLVSRIKAADERTHFVLLESAPNGIACLEAKGVGDEHDPGLYDPGDNLLKDMLTTFSNVMLVEDDAKTEKV